jgi:hypothetical protein
MHICLHELLNQINFCEVIKARRAEYVKDGDDVFVLKMAEKFDLAKGAEAKHGVIKGSYSFDGDLALCRDMDCRTKG